MNNSINFADTSPQELNGVLKATGSTDPDILFAAKTQFASRFVYLRGAGLLLMIVAGISCVTIVLIPVAFIVVPVGWWMWRKGKRNLAVIEGAYQAYLGAVGPNRAVATA
jgi:hypothetical protein